jgi:hypothetical protein
MPNLEYKILPPTDEQAIRGLRQIGTDLGAASDSSLDVRLFDNSQPFTVPLATAEKHAVLKPVVDLGLSTLKYLRVPYSAGQGFAQGLQITVNRGNDGLSSVSVHLPEPSGQDRLAAVSVAVRSAFKPFEQTPQLDATLGAALAEFHRAREGSLLHLERLASDVVEGTTRARQQLEQEFEAYRAKLRTETGSERERLQEEYQKRHEKLAAEKADLDAQRKEIDDRKNTIARRQLRADLKKEISARNTNFDLTAQAKQKRLPVHILFMALIALAATAAGFSLHAANAVSTSNWQSALLPTIRFGLATLTLVATTVFYIRWNDQWARQHADEEFQLKRLDLDIDRASWVVETALEWKEE